ncbi:MAG: dihydroorotate dehydrogenase electron transfer subunit [Bacteroidales bacterium]|nr:dihydroorotate dehydrogenase electron transfer subunit [Bacteroidales bacterium]
MRIEELELVSNRPVADGYFVLDLHKRGGLPGILPGQFVQFRVDNDKNTFLRRPISVYDIDYDRGIISLLIKKVGSGTRAMAGLYKGMKVNLVYPLGNSFSLPGPQQRSLLVGGGVGVAPLLLLARVMKGKSLDFKFLLGYQSVDHIIEKQRYSELAELLITTDDGSYGYKGLITEHPELAGDDYDNIYCCGPEAMMKSVAGIARSKGKFCEVSLENTMACGYGVCLCCVEDTVKGNVCTCTEGPVFNINELRWQI